MALNCHHCLEPATSDGPFGNGSEEVALLRDTEMGWVLVFCSPACRTWWVGLIYDGGAQHTDHIQVADGVSESDAERVIS